MIVPLQDLPMTVKKNFKHQIKCSREEFADFVYTHRTRGVSLFGKLTTWYQKIKLDFQQNRGQCYDGASNMSSDDVGLSGLVTAENPNSPYFHCSSHRLNLTIGRFDF